jgi:nicotinamidase-related amidase
MSAMSAATAERSAHLTRHDAVLLLVDYQVGPLWELEAIPLRRDVVRVAREIARLGVPTIMTTLERDHWGPVIPELREAVPDASVVERLARDAWERDAWDAAAVQRAIESTGRTHLVVAGAATELSLVRVAVAVARAGYNVHALMDASGHFDPVAALAAVARMRRAGVRLTQSRIVQAELARRSSERCESDWTSPALSHLLPSPPALPGERSRPRSRPRAADARRSRARLRA